MITIKAKQEISAESSSVRGLEATLVDFWRPNFRFQRGSPDPELGGCA